MGVLTETVSRFLKATAVRNQGLSVTVPTWQNGVAQFPNQRYDTYARDGYMRNEVVFACIDELATSAAEPKLMARTGSRWRHDGQILEFLNNPNPFMDHFTLWATVIMHRSLAGNAYGLIVRSASGKPAQLWLLRPDRVRVVPSRENYISHYTYDIGGGEVIPLPPEDVIHWKNRHPLDDWYGMPPLMAVSGRTDIDNFMKDFVKSAFQNGGMPGAVLTVKQKVPPEDKEQIRNRFRNTFGGPSGWHELLILDNAEASYTPMTMGLGSRGLVVPELDEISIQRICSAFHVFPPLIGYMKDSGGYNSLFALERHWWTSTLIPLYKELAGPLNLRLVPNFPRVAEVQFDMTDVWALRDDVDKVALRWSNLAQRGIATVQEAREAVGLPRDWNDDDVFLVPSASVGVLGDDLAQPDADPANAVPQSRRGRLRTEDDPAARAVYDQAVSLKMRSPSLSWEQVAAQVGVTSRTLRAYREVFSSLNRSE